MLCGKDTSERQVDRVCDQLLTFIIDRNLGPGDRLPPEQELARLTAVSRPILREALKRLQGHGLVEARLGAGTFVRQRPFEHQIQHLLPAHARNRIARFEIRLALEPSVARMAALHRTQADLQEIKAAAADLFAALSAGEPAGHCDYHLHRSIAVASHNSIMPLTLDDLSIGEEGRADSASAVVAAHDPERTRSLQFEHAAIVEAIERCEPETAETAMRLHLLRARTRRRLL